MIKKALFIITILFTFKSIAQQKPENKLGTWYMYNGTHKLSEKFAIKSMAHFRYFEIAEAFQQEIYRLGLNYNFNPKTNLTFGMVYATADVSYDEASVNLYEYRFYQDLNLKSKWGNFSGNHLLRMEQRFIHRDLNTDQFQNWFVYNLTIGRPLSKRFSAFAFNQLFLNINSSKRFVQNWTGAGILYKLNESIKLKTGYFHIRTPNLVLKRLQLGIVLNTTHFTKTK